MKKTPAKKPDIRERRVYFFACQSCGKKRRQSFRRRKAREKLCRGCRRGAVPENQLALLPPTPTNPEVSTP